MNWKRIGDLNTWKDVGIELMWKIGPSSSIKPTPSWLLDDKKLCDALIYRPSKYDWAPAHAWVEPLFSGFKRFIKVKVADIPQLWQGIVLIKVMRNNSAYDIAIDYHSNSEMINEALASRCFLYFKMHYIENGYAIPGIIPGGFVNWRNDIYSYLPHLRNIRANKSFLYDVYGRFGLKTTEGIRARAINILAGQNKFSFCGGASLVRYSRYLREIARAKICVDLPGYGDFCFRLLDYLAIGTCVIGLKPKTMLHVPLVDRKHIVYAKNDLSDFIDLCEYYIKNNEERERICKNSGTFFDQYLHRDQLAAYYLYKFFEKLGKK